MVCTVEHFLPLSVLLVRIATVQLGTTSFEAVLFVRICQELSPKWMMLIDRLSALQDRAFAAQIVCQDIGAVCKTGLP